MTESQVLHLIPAIGGGVTAIHVALKIHPVKGRRPEHSDEIRPVAAQVEAHLRALAARRLVKRIGADYWRAV